MKLTLPDGREIEAGINIQDLPPGTKLEARIEKVPKPTTTLIPNGYCENQQEFQQTCNEAIARKQEADARAGRGLSYETPLAIGVVLLLVIAFKKVMS